MLNTFLYLSVLLQLFTFGCKKLPDSEVSAITGSAEGHNVALGLLPVHAKMDPDFVLGEWSKDPNIASVQKMVIIPYFALVQCSAGANGSPDKVMLRAEQLAYSGNLLLTVGAKTDKRTLGFLNQNSEFQNIECAVVGERMASWLVIAEAGRLMGLIPMEQPKSDAMSADIAKTYAFAQAMFLAMRGSTDMNSLTGPVELGNLKKLAEMATMNDSIVPGESSASRLAAFKSSIPVWDPLFNPCLPPQSSWIIKTLRDGLYRCDPVDGSPNLRNYKAGATETDFTNVRNLLAKEIEIKHQEIFSKAPFTSELARAAWDLLSGTVTAKTAAGKNSFAAKLILGGRLDSMFAATSFGLSAGSGSAQATSAQVSPAKPAADSFIRLPQQWSNTPTASAGGTMIFRAQGDPVTIGGNQVYFEKHITNGKAEYRAVNSGNNQQKIYESGLVVDPATQQVKFSDFPKIFGGQTPPQVEAVPPIAVPNVEPAIRMPPVQQGAFARQDLTQAPISTSGRVPSIFENAISNRVAENAVAESQPTGNVNQSATMWRMTPSVEPLQRVSFDPFDPTNKPVYGVPAYNQPMFNDQDWAKLATQAYSSPTPTRATITPATISTQQQAALSQMRPMFNQGQTSYEGPTIDEQDQRLSLWRRQ